MDDLKLCVDCRHVVLRFPKHEGPEAWDCGKWYTKPYQSPVDGSHKPARNIPCMSARAQSRLCGQEGKTFAAK